MLCDDGLALLRTEYLNRIDFGETDILARLRRVFLAKTELMARYPWIFEFTRTVSQIKPESAGGGARGGLQAFAGGKRQGAVLRHRHIPLPGRSRCRTMQKSDLLEPHRLLRADDGRAS